MEIEENGESKETDDCKRKRATGKIKKMGDGNRRNVSGGRQKRTDERADSKIDMTDKKERKNG